MIFQCYGSRGTCTLLFLSAAFFAIFSLAAGETEFDPQLLAGLEARSIGPAGMSGRITAITAVPDNPRVVYVGTATGGVWKSTNAGLNFEPVFDDQPVHAIGALCLDPQRPQTLWVGTGEGNVRNSVSIGNGVYRSQDGGKTWQHMGLSNTERINRIMVDPTDSQTLYVAALGKLWGENPERGLFKTSDGGNTWQKVLYKDERTGCTDIVMDPRNPNKLFAAMWQFRRWPHFFKSGGPGSGLYRSVDAGATWQRLEPEDGLPKGELGRISLAIAPSDNRRVYALVEADQSVFLRSDDGGFSFQTVNQDTGIADRPFYYCRIQVDPQDPNRIYKKETLVNLSTDGGRTFAPLKGAQWPKIHVDYHAIWINPANPFHLYLGNDGGVAESHDQGDTFRFVANLPLAQFYHIAVDNADPYHVYGGLQDNGSWRGPAEVRRGAGIRNHFWEMLSFGDGFDTVPDPHEADTGYAMWQGGNLVRWDTKSGLNHLAAPPPTVDGVPLRYNWSAGLAVDPFQAGRVYYGAQMVMQSDDHGRTWRAISQDLTTNKPEWRQQHKSGGLTLDVTAAENYTTISAIRPSPMKAGLLWVGTDDGRLWLTRNGGENWQSLEGKIRNLPKHAWVAHIHASKHNEGTAFVVFDNHRRSDFGIYVYRTDNFGDSWQALAGEGVSGYALSLIQDPVAPELLYLGTEFGLYISLNSGKHWFKWTFGLPTTSVMDLAFQEREHDLVIGSHGRGIYIIDDVRPLRALVGRTLATDIELLPPQPATPYVVQPMKGGVSVGWGDYQGQNEAYGAWFDVFAAQENLPFFDKDIEKERQAKKRRAERAEAVKKQGDGLPSLAAEKTSKPKDETKKDTKDDDEEAMFEVQIFDGDQRIRHFFTKAYRGFNRIAWDLRTDPVLAAPVDENDPFKSTARTFEVGPGQYQVKLTLGEQTVTNAVSVLAHANLAEGSLDVAARNAAVTRWTQLNDKAVMILRRLARIRADLALLEKRVAATLIDEPETARKRLLKEHALLRAGRELLRDQKALEAELWVAPTAKGIQSDQHIWGYINDAGSKCFSGPLAPTPTQLSYLVRAEEALAAWLPRYETYLNDRVKPFAAEVAKQSFGVSFQFDREP